MWACIQLAPIYVNKSESALQIFSAETNEPKENETRSLSFPISNSLKRKGHSAVNGTLITLICVDHCREVIGRDEEYWSKEGDFVSAKKQDAYCI